MIVEDWRPGPMEIREIMRHIPHRYPFILVDRILELEPGRRIVGLKNVSANEPFFTGHFPGHPIMSAVLLVEAMPQAPARRAPLLPAAERQLADVSTLPRRRS